jgi:putative DNA primase/helicase
MQLGIPDQLRRRPHWVTWTLETRTDKDGEKKATKVPRRPNDLSINASSTDPSTWAAYAVALATCPKPGAKSGIGFMFGGSGFTGIDLDNCIDTDTGEVAPWAAKIVEEFNSYSELSPSGRGIHIFVEAQMPGGKGHSRAYGGGKVESYSEGRFFTVTGRQLAGTPPTIEKRQEVLNAFVERLWPQKPEPAPPRSSAGLTLSDQEILEKCRRAANGAKFCRLYDSGDLTEYAGDHSDADLALVGIMAFYTDDEAQLDRLFRSSAMFRLKWEERRPEGTYGLRTIGVALASKRRSYDPQHHRAQATEAPAAAQSRVSIEPNGKPRDMRLHLTDYGNAERLVRRHGENLRYCPHFGKWLFWSGLRWEFDETGEVVRRAKETTRSIYAEAALIETSDIRKAVVDWAAKSEARARIDAMIALAESEPGIPIKPQEMDADPWLLNCLNGTIDLRTGECPKHRREDFLTKLAPVVYDPEAKSEEWDTFLDTATDRDPELRDFLQRAAGYTMTGSVEEEVIFLVCGPAAAGKSTFNEALKAVLGDYASTADFESFIVRKDTGAPRNDIARLVGARFVLSIEVEEGKHLAEAMMKWISGGDTITARFFYKEFFEFVPQFTLWLVCNHAPRVRHDDDAIWRRIHQIPFRHVIPKENRDKQLKGRLKDTALTGPAILAWMVKGCLEWRKNGLGVPRTVTQATQDYREAQDPLREFFEDRCILAELARVENGELYLHYQEYCRRSGDKFPLGHRHFSQQLKDRGFKQVVTGGSRFWKGIGLLAPAQPSLAVEADGEPGDESG